MQAIREQDDLALLPEPRFICTAPAWFRRFATCLLVIGALVSALVAGNVVVGGMAGITDRLIVLSGVIALSVCLSLLVWGRPTDWRAWIDLAATPEGVFLVGRARRVVFVPWRDVVDLAVVRLPGPRGTRPFARLTLRLSDESWAELGNLSGIEGTGAVRSCLMSALAMPGDELVAGLEPFRAGSAGPS